MKTFFVISNSNSFAYRSSTSPGMSSLTEDATLLITSASCDVKFKKSVRYDTRSSSEFLMSSGSTSCVNMTGHVFSDSMGSCSEEAAVEPESCELRVVVLNESGVGVRMSARCPEYGHILSAAETLLYRELLLDILGW
jgi:hypothetical protein